MDEQTQSREAELSLSEAEGRAIEALSRLGRASASELAEASGLSQLRLYYILEDLTELGLVQVYPRDPIEYEAAHPAEFEDHLEATTETPPVAGGGEKPAESLSRDFEAVESPSAATEMFCEQVQTATKSVDIITECFSSFDDVEAALEMAYNDDISLRVLFIHPSHLEIEASRRQAEIVERFYTDFPDAEVRFSMPILPWEGCLVDRKTNSERAVVAVTDPVDERAAFLADDADYIEMLTHGFDHLWREDAIEDATLG